jgi:hypothetical protein
MFPALLFPNWGAFAFSRSAYQNCLVCPSVCMKHLENRWADFNRIRCWEVDPKCSHSLQFVSSVVSIVTRYGLDCPVSDFQQGKRLFLYPKRPVRLLDQPSLVFSGCWRLFRGGIWTLNLRRVPRWRMSGAVPFFPIFTFIPCTKTSFIFIQIRLRSFSISVHLFVKSTVIMRAFW